ncbi:hypothetical protein [Ruegeria arenilitoris]|uniref:hypothetical protein n=1 Tax=Ruegeria arenilitoris TaxID=1173585 RepID=UPI00147F2C9E|nr:hypothetical protein [Ruegeria arenilitoris]
MSNLNPNIILAGNQPNPVNAFARGQALRAQTDQSQHQNALRNLFQQQGANILAGDSTALNALAQFDPGAALEIRGQHQVQNNRAATARRQAEMHERAINAAEVEQDLAKIRQGIAQAAALHAQGDLQGINQLLAQVNHPPIQSLDEFHGVAMKFADAEKAIADFLAPKDRDFSNFKVVGNQLYDLSAEGGPAVVGSSRQTPGFSVTTPDGTVVQHGWQGDTPPGQNPDATGTPRNPTQLGKELSKIDAAALEEINAAGRTATDLESLATQLDTVAPQVGYTGPGGQAYGFVDDVVGFLPGDSGARGAFKSLAMEAQLTFTEKTKGAITDREMGMFRAAVPNLGQTPEGNAAIAQIMKAGAARAQSRAAFFENWARKHGSLEGAQEVWSEYMRDNPLISQGQSGEIQANPEGDWQSYLNRQPAMSYTPENIMQMDAAGLAQIPIEKLTGPQLDALERRFQDLSQ